MYSQESAASSKKPKRSRKQSFADLDAEGIKSTQPQISASPSHLKSMINVISTGSDNEIRIVTAPKRSRPPNGAKLGKKCLTTLQREAVVKASEQGTKKSDIAKMFDTSIKTVYSILDQYRSEGTVKQKFFGNTNAKKTTPEIEQFIVNASQNDVGLSVSDAVIAVKKKFGVQIKAQTLRNVRHKNGLVGHRL